MSITVQSPSAAALRRPFDAGSQNRIRVVGVLALGVGVMHHEFQGPVWTGPSPLQHRQVSVGAALGYPGVRGDSVGMFRSHARPVPAMPTSEFKGFRFPPEIIVLAVRWYLRYGLSYRDVE